MNLVKYNSYREAFRLMNLAEEKNNLAYSIAAIALAESVISDRAQSYILYKENKWYTKQKGYVSTTKLIKRCKKNYPSHKLLIKKKKGIIWSTNNLFEEIKDWLKNRNEILHGFAKSKPGMPTITYEQFVKKAIQTSKRGLVLSSLIIKWHKQQRKEK